MKYIEKNKSSRFKKRPISALEKSRRYMILEGVTGIGQFSMTTGAFLAGFVSYLGGSESLNGTLGVIPAAMGILQIFSTLLLKKSSSRKSTVIPLAILLRIFLSSIYFVPFIMMQLGATSGLMMLSFILCFGAAFGFNSLIAPILSGWLVDLTPLSIRGNYLAKREKISMGFVAFFTIILGRVLDYNKALGAEFMGFLIVGILLVIMGILNIYALVHCADVTQEVKDDVIPLRQQLINNIKDPVFNKVIMMSMLWNFSLFVGAPFIAVYMVETLNLTYTYMMTMTVMSTIVRVLFTSFWGNLADKKSWFSCGTITLVIIGLNHMLWGFVTPENNQIVVPILYFSGGVAWAGAGISLFNIQFLFAKPKWRTSAIGINAAIGGVVGFLAVKLGAGIIELMSARSLSFIFGIRFTGVQITFLLSGIFIILTGLFIHFVLRPLPLQVSKD